MQSHILLEGLTVQCIVGLLPSERINKQNLVINLALEIDFHKSAEQDELLDSVDYAELALSLEQFIQVSQFKTLESAVWNCVHFIFSKYMQPKSIDLELIKPTAISNCPKAGIKIKLNRDEWINSPFNKK